MTDVEDLRNTHRPPRLAGTVGLADGRELAFAEFGDPDGVPVLWLHGTPGCCRQVAPAAVAAAMETGVRIIGIARPGSGDSTPTSYPNVAAITDDVEQLADRMGLERFSVVGLSGGGPYTLAIGAGLSDRVGGLCVLGGVAPTVGQDAADGGAAGLAVTMRAPLRYMHRPMGKMLNVVLKPLIPLGNNIGDALFSVLPEGDRKVFQTPGVKEMFIGDLARSITEGYGIHAAMRDTVLFGRHWGFELDEVTVPVDWWHGDEDWCVPLEHGEWMVERLPDATLHMIPGGSHLTGYAAADEVVAAASSHLR